MSALLAIRDERDVVKRRRLSLSDIPPEDQKLLDAYRYWQSKRVNNLLPARKEIDILNLRPVLGRTHLIDVRTDNPADYRIKLYGSMVPIGRGRDLTNLPIGQYPSRAYSRALIEDYQQVCLTGVPCYQQVVASLDFVPYSYGRLILPLADDGRRVDTLLVCINPRKFTDLAV